MKNNHNSDMEQSIDFYQRLLNEEKEQKNQEENEQQQIDLEKQWMDKFYMSNEEMIKYLSEHFDGHPNFLSLMQYSIMKVVQEYPKLSAKDFADFYTSKFTFNDKTMFTNDLDKYMIKKMKFRFMTDKTESKDWSSIEEFENLYSNDLTEYLTCIVYSKLKSFEQFSSWEDYKSNSNPFKMAFNFYPISNMKYALGKEFWFKGHVDRMFKTTSRNGYPYAHIFIKDQNWEEYKAVVRTKNFYSLLNGLTNMRDSNCDVAIYGKLSKDKFGESIIIHVEKFTLKTGGTYINYPTKYY